MRFFKWGATFIFITSIIYLFFIPENHSDSPIKNFKKDNKKFYTLNRSKYHHWNEDGGSINIVSEQMLMKANSRSILLKKLKGVIELSTQDKRFNIAADEGLLSGNKKILILKGNIYLNDKKNYSLRSEEMVYDQEKQEIRSKKKILLKSSNQIIKGLGFLYSLKKGTLKVFKAQITQ